MAEQYDNTNRGSMWVPLNYQNKPRICAGGKINVAGADMFCDFVPCKKHTDKAPAAHLYVRDMQGICFCVPLWEKSTDNPDYLYSGTLNVGGGGEYFCNIWRGKGGTGNSPALTISLQEKKPKPEAQAVGQGYNQDSGGNPYGGEDDGSIPF